MAHARNVNRAPHNANVCAPETNGFTSPCQRSGSILWRFLPTDRSPTSKVLLMVQTLKGRFLVIAEICGRQLLGRRRRPQVDTLSSNERSQRHGERRAMATKVPSHWGRQTPSEGDTAFLVAAAFRTQPPTQKSADLENDAHPTNYSQSSSNMSDAQPTLGENEGQTARCRFRKHRDQSQRAPKTKTKRRPKSTRLQKTAKKRGQESNTPESPKKCIIWNQRSHYGAAKQHDPTPSQPPESDRTNQMDPT